MAASVPAPPPGCPRSTSPRTSAIERKQLPRKEYAAPSQEYAEAAPALSTGTPLPCDDAGIPGAGGSSAPCRLFTVEEVESRGWPGVAAEALAAFLEDGPEYVLRASEMERG